MVVIHIGFLSFPASDAGTKAVRACHQSQLLSRPGIAVSASISNWTSFTSRATTVPAPTDRNNDPGITDNSNRSDMAES
jgi:hypothetical protein